MNLFGWMFFTLTPILLIVLLYMVIAAIYEKIEEIIIDREFKDEG